jgi:hypothetical protein
MKPKATRRHKRQKGGFYPSIMEGVRGAALLTPLAVRQAYRLLGNSSGTRRRRSKRTHKTARKTRSSLKHRVLPAK